MCFQLCLILCDHVDCRLPGSSVHRILQAKIVEWVAISSSRGFSQHRDWTSVSYSSCIGRQIPYHWATWEALTICELVQIIIVKIKKVSEKLRNFLKDPEQITGKGRVLAHKAQALHLRILEVRNPTFNEMTCMTRGSMTLIPLQLQIHCYFTTLSSP